MRPAASGRLRLADRSERCSYYSYLVDVCRCRGVGRVRNRVTDPYCDQPDDGLANAAYIADLADAGA